MKKVTFPVSIGQWNEIEVTLKVSEKDAKALDRCEESGEYDCFEDCERLEPLYERVIEAAWDAMANGAMADDDFIDTEFDGERDFDTVREYLVDNYDICAEWPTAVEDA